LNVTSGLGRYRPKVGPRAAGVKRSRVQSQQPDNVRLTPSGCPRSRECALYASEDARPSTADVRRFEIELGRATTAPRAAATLLTCGAVLSRSPHTPRPDRSLVHRAAIVWSGQSPDRRNRRRFAHPPHHRCRGVRNDPGLLVTGRGRFGTRCGELNGGTTHRGTGRGPCVPGTVWQLKDGHENRSIGCFQTIGARCPRWRAGTTGWRRWSTAPLDRAAGSARPTRSLAPYRRSRSRTPPTRD